MSDDDEKYKSHFPTAQYYFLNSFSNQQLKPEDV